MKNILVTGATGLFGCALARLIVDDGHKIIALVRGGSERARDRFERLLRKQEDLDGKNLPDNFMEKITVFDCDISEKESLDRVVSYVKGDKVNELWHCAACVTFTDKQLCERVNYGGTKNILELAASIGCEKFFHISTAYIAGGYSGTVVEDEMPPALSQNAYEKTKYESEMMVRRQSEIPFSIFRPSIIVGNKLDGKIRDFKNFYLFLRFFAKLRKRREILPISFPSFGESSLNLVPIDFCVSAAWRIGRENEPGRTYHLVNDAPPTIKEVVRAIENVIGQHCIDFVGPDHTLTEEEQLVAARFQEFMPYLFSSPEFDNTNVKNALGDLDDSRLSGDGLEQVIRYYYDVECARRRRAGKRPLI